MLVDCLVWLICAFFGAGSYGWLVRRYPNSFRAVNFQGDLIPNSAGLVVVLATEPACIWLMRLGSRLEIPHVRSVFLVVIAFGVLGLADDLYGDRSVGGLRGHFTQLFIHGKLTTGAVKAFGGTIAALGAGYLLHSHSLIEAFLAASIITLSANAVNLVDTRPGRSLFFCFVLAVIPTAIGLRTLGAADSLIFLPPLLIAIVIFVYDRQAQLMIGDVGANSLGSLVGLLWAVETPVAAQALFLSALIWLHIWTESHSISRTIESSHWLRRLDRKIGVRRL